MDIGDAITYQNDTLLGVLVILLSILFVLSLDIFGKKK
jgi:hypothetical protein